MVIVGNYLWVSAQGCSCLLSNFVERHLVELAFLFLEEVAEVALKISIVPGIVLIEL